MKYKVTKKQNNSRMCLVCGMENDFGMKAMFYELENGELAALFNAREEHQSYPERMHGGMIGAILDEVICRAIMIPEPDIWGITLELAIKYRKPTPLNQMLQAVGRVTKNTRKFFEGTAEVRLNDGTVIATATGKYLKTPIAQISDAFHPERDWILVPDQNDPVEIDL